MSKNAMPFLIVNYGAEMVFILEQRLHAQNVKNEKSTKVLQDVTKSMFATQFVQELMRPQELYTVPATREIFDRLAQSSIMKLSENSMDKLYDLMTMGCKYQIISCKHPLELVELTLNHIDTVYDAVKGGQSGDHLTHTNDQVVKLARTLPAGVMADVRHSLLNFYQGKRVKVSLFLNDGLQTSDGFFVLPRGGEVPTEPPVQPIGVIKYFQNGQQTMAGEFPHPDKAIVRPAPHPTNVFDAPQRTTPLGRNLYIADRKKKEGAAAAATATPAATKEPAPAPTPAPVPAAQPQPATQSAGSPLQKRTSFRARSTMGASSGGGAGLNSLSALIGGAPPKESFKVNLFGGDDNYASGSSSGATDASGAPTIEIGRLSREDMMKNNQELMGVMGNFDAAGGQQTGAGGNADAGQDLLDLMDGA